LPRIFPEATDHLTLCNQALKNICSQSDNPTLKFSAWAGALPIKNIQSLQKRLCVPNEFSDLALLVQKQLEFYEQSTQLPPPDILDGLKASDAFRRPERFENYLLAAEAISQAKPKQEHWPQPQREYLHTARLQAAAINTKDLTKVRLEGKALAEELDIHRRAAISKIKRTYRWAKFT
jgi:tRNA nucleotidyltransferase (CCA-adding enzyme)